MNNQECNETSISKILNCILELQRGTESVNLDSTTGCDRKSLGPNISN